ncbi:MAG: type II toxin-antitoxin system VapC family toxin [Candidatus Sulfotelmatobacter sp.]
MSLVLDSSLTMAWIHRDETTRPVEEVFERLSQTGAWVPSPWRLEVANVLEMNVRRRRYAANFRDGALSDLSFFPIQLDPETNRRAWGATASLAERHRLTLYDAAYLELALRRGLPLATLDRELRAAAENQSVQLLGV